MMRFLTFVLLPTVSFAFDVITATLDNANARHDFNGNHFVGFNEGGSGPSIENVTLPQNLAAVAALNPGTLRYPGGTHADYWDWRTGGCLPGLNKTLPGPLPSECKEYAKWPWTLEKFAQIIAHTNHHATPVFDLNVLTSTPEEQVAMLQHASTLGLPIKMVELGNEFYLCGKNFIKIFPTAASYAATANAYAIAIRHAFPRAQIAAVGGLFDGDNCGERRPTWDHGLDEGGLNTSLISALTFHPYFIPGGNLSSLTNYTYGTLSQQQHEIAVLRADPGGFLGEPDAIYADGRVAKMMQAQLGRLGSLRRWVTEYNIIQWPGGPTQNPVFLSWAHALVVTASALHLMRIPNLDTCMMHTLLNGWGWGAIFQRKNGLYFLKGSGNEGPRPTTRFAKTASGWALGLLSHTLQEMRTATPLVFAKSPTQQSWRPNSIMPTDPVATYPVLLGAAFSRSSSTITAAPATSAAFVINRAPNGLDVDVSRVFTGSAPVRVRLLTPACGAACGAAAWVAGPDDVANTTKLIAVGGSDGGQTLVTVPAFGIVALEQA